MNKLRVLIINPAVRLNDKPRNLPHGLAIIANVIRKKAGIDPIFLDINANRYSDKEVEDIINKVDFDVVLMGGVASVYRSMVELSKMVKKKNPDAKIAVGGYVAMPIPKILLENSFVDIVCSGEGEITIVDLLKTLEAEGLDADLSKIRGIWYKNNGQMVSTQAASFISNLDEESMMPAYDLLPMHIYLSNPVAGLGRDVDMVTTRGCPFLCSFCYQPWGHRPRFHSVDFIINTVRYLREKYDIDFVSFQDDEFMTDRKRVRDFCDKRNKEFSNLFWSCTGRANIISKDEEIVILMRESGCTLISCGFESGSQRMLDRMKKKQKIEEMEKTVAILRKNELPVPVSFIIGMPGENEESCQETVDFCLRNNLPLDSLMFATPYPGAEIFDFALTTGKIDKESIHGFMMRLGDARDFLVNLTDSFTDEQLIEKRREMMEVTRKNYEKFITVDEIIDKTKKIFGPLMNKIRFDQKDLEHRAKHGGMSIF